MYITSRPDEVLHDLDEEQCDIADQSEDKADKQSIVPFADAHS